MNRLSQSWAISITTLLIASFACSLPARPDFIILKNGDRITGQIRQIWDSELTIEPAYGDEWDVDLAEIVEIVSDRSFEIELADGTAMTAVLNGVDQAGAQRIAADGATRTIPLSAIAELDEPEYFEWDSSIDANTVVNEGNTDSRTVRISGTSNLKLGNHRHTGDLTLADESLDGVSTKEQRLLSYAYGWLFRDPMFVSAIDRHQLDITDAYYLSFKLDYDYETDPRPARKTRISPYWQASVSSSER